MRVAEAELVPDGLAEQTTGRSLLFLTWLLPPVEALLFV
jgi:hypothetical protein